MIEVTEDKDTYLADFARFEKSADGGRPSWLRLVRKGAIARFAELGFPTTQHEEWRYTNVAPIAQTAFVRAERADVSRREVEPFTFGGPAHLLVFVNGVLAPELGAPAALPKGVEAGSLAAALHNGAGWVEHHLARHASYREQAFVALNTAFMQEGGCVHIPRGVVVETPIHILHVCRTTGRSAVQHPRTLIVAEENSQATIVESYVGLGEGVYFTNAVTEIVAAGNAVVDYCKVQRESEAAYHLGTLALHQFRSSNVSAHTVSLGGGTVRHDFEVLLDGEGGNCVLDGLYVLTRQQQCENHLRVEHARPHCDSREFFKGILDGASHGAFSGRIVVRKDAQKTDAKQTNMNLLLSESARVDSKPQLEIFADDVKCTHGATIGQVNADALFYLRSRGISAVAALSLLVYAFARESLDRVKLAPLRARLEAALLARLPQGELLRGAAALKCAEF